MHFKIKSFLKLFEILLQLGGEVQSVDLIFQANYREILARSLRLSLKPIKLPELNNFQRQF